MVIFHSYVSLPEGTYEFKKKHSQFWRKWGPKHHQVEVDYWVHTIHGFGCQAFQHVLLLGVTATPLEKSEPPLEKFASAPCWHLHHAGCWLNRVPLGSPYYYPPIIWCHVTVISRVCICLDKILDCTVHKIHNTSGYIRSDMSLKSPLCKKNHRTFTSFSIYPGDKNKSIKHILQPYVDLTHVFGTPKITVWISCRQFEIPKQVPY